MAFLRLFLSFDLVCIIVEKLLSQMEVQVCPRKQTGHWVGNSLVKWEMALQTRQMLEGKTLFKQVQFVLKCAQRSHSLWICICSIDFIHQAINKGYICVPFVDQRLYFNHQVNNLAKGQLRWLEYVCVLGGIAEGHFSNSVMLVKIISRLTSSHPFSPPSPGRSTHTHAWLVSSTPQHNCEC